MIVQVTQDWINGWKIEFERDLIDCFQRAERLTREWNQSFVKIGRQDLIEEGHQVLVQQQRYIEQIPAYLQHLSQQLEEKSPTLEGALIHRRNQYLQQNRFFVEQVIQGFHAIWIFFHSLSNRVKEEGDRAEQDIAYLGLLERIAEDLARCPGLQIECDEEGLPFLRNF